MCGKGAESEEGTWPKGIRVDRGHLRGYKNSEVKLEVNIAAAEPTSGNVIGVPENSDALAGPPRPDGRFDFGEE